MSSDIVKGPQLISKTSKMSSLRRKMTYPDMESSPTQVETTSIPNPRHSRKSTILGLRRKATMNKLNPSGMMPSVAQGPHGEVGRQPKREREKTVRLLDAIEKTRQKPEESEGPAQDEVLVLEPAGLSKPDPAQHTAERISGELGLRGHVQHRAWCSTSPGAFCGSGSAVISHLVSCEGVPSCAMWCSGGSRVAEDACQARSGAGVRC